MLADMHEELQKVQDKVANEQGKLVTIRRQQATEKRKLKEIVGCVEEESSGRRAGSGSAAADGSPPSRRSADIA